MLNYSNLNKEQIKGLANFFFDIAKAGVIGSITLSGTTDNLIVKTFIGLGNIFLSFICLTTALKLLRQIK